jgi:hypothetical protein
MTEGPTLHLDLETLHGLLDSALSAEQAARAEAHLTVCAECAEEIASLKAVFVSLASLPEEPLRVDLRPRVMAGLGTVRRSGLRIGWLLGAQAAVAALGVWIAWPWLGDMLSSLQGIPLSERVLSGLLAFAEDVGEAWEGLAAPALDAFGSLSVVRWVPPIAVGSLPQIIGVVIAATALCLVGNGVLLRAARAASRRGERYR